MQGNRPMNRKKNIDGQASEDSMKTHGEGRGEGPVGSSDGYQERKNATDTLRDVLNQATRPLNRPKNVDGQASQSSMQTHGSGFGSSAPQQQRPAASDQGTQRPVQQLYQQSSNSSSGNSSNTPNRGGKGGILIIALLALLLLGGGGGLSGLFGGGSDGSTGDGQNNTLNTAVTQVPSTSQGYDWVNQYQATSAPTARPTAAPTQAPYSNQNDGDNNTTDISDYLAALLGESNQNDPYTLNTATPRPTATRRPTATPKATKKPSSSTSSSSASDLLSQMLGGSWYASQTGNYSSASTQAATTSSSSASTSYTIPSANYSSVNRSVAAGSRDKFTAIKGNGKDTVTIMVYMCGADLESKSAMATRDLQEMLNAKLGSKINLIVYTGGSSRWQNNVVKSDRNQVYQIKDGQLITLVDNAGTASMTTPSTLSSFIQFCAKNFPANRNMLILWDHGSGSVSGYGYDEKNPRSGSMSLAGLNTAFKDGGVKFDFIGFDTCLMATVENALMASKYADYLIASEESEPGIGWYYTNWLTKLGSNTSMNTLDIGQNIIDDFVSACNSQCRGQMTTLSIVDLAELEHTVPASLASFSQSVTQMISNQEYRAVSTARNGSREFASSARIDQVDLSDLCDKLGTQESAQLAATLRSAVKYNRINNISNAYGLSVYFPYQKVGNVDKAVSNYEAIGMDSSYADAIRAFASVEASGQAVSGGGSVMPSLFGSSSSSGSYDSADMIGELLSAFLGGSGSSFFSGRNVNEEELRAFLTANYLDDAQLKFVKDGDAYVLSLPESQWALVNGADMNMFYKTADGYIDLGLDNLFEFDGQGRMVADVSGTWMAINGQPVAYYHEDTQQDGNSWRISGRVPALLNGERVDLILVFDQDNEKGYVAGARTVYLNGETDTVAKNLIEVKSGDELVFLADLYDNDMNFHDSYQLGNAITVGDALTISDRYLPDTSSAVITYRFTDLYNQAHWAKIER